MVICGGTVSAARDVRGRRGEVWGGGGPDFATVPAVTPGSAWGDEMKGIRSKLSALMGIIVLLFSGLLFYRSHSLIQSWIERDVHQQTALALCFSLATREYIAEVVRPITLRLSGGEDFIPETMSTSFAAREVFDRLRRRFPDYVIKFSSGNPRNPANRAGPEELDMIRYFNEHPREKTWSGYISMAGRPYYAQFSAMRMEESCLQCHSNPAYAPASLIQRYGPSAGFHLPLGEVVGLDTVAVPVERIQTLVRNETITSFAVLGGFLLALFAAIQLVLRFTVTDRLSFMAAHFERAEDQVGDGPIKRIEIGGRDEITVMAEGFNRLSSRLNDAYRLLEDRVADRTLELTEANRRLEMEIAERQRAQEALQQSHNDLDRRIRARTQDLERVNQDLMFEIAERGRAEAEREKLIEKLQAALNEVKTLKGFIPICASCKQVRNDDGYWQQVEQYVQDRTEAQFSHGICPACARKLYPEMFKE